MEVFHARVITSTATVPNQLGQHKMDRYGNLLQIVKFTGSTVATVRGGAAGYVTTSNQHTVTPDISTSSSLRPAGVPLCSLTAASTNAGTAYGFILKRGNVGNYHSQIKTGGSAVAGARIRWQADKVWTTVTASAASITGVSAGLCLITDSGSICKAAGMAFNIPS
jgi:hypothetical protein